MLCNSVSTILAALGRVFAAFATPIGDSDRAGRRAAISLLLLAVAAPPVLAQDFGPPQILNTNAFVDTASDYNPSVAGDSAGNWVAVWWSEDSLGGTIGDDGDILVARSADGGATWTAPASLKTNAATDSCTDMNPRVATDGAGSWVVVWRCLHDILVSRSTDAGVTWTAPAKLNTDPRPTGQHDYLPQIASDGAGIWIAVWSRDPSDNRYFVVMARSTDDGVTWEPPAELSLLGEEVKTDSPTIASDGAGNWLVASAVRGGGIHFAHSTDSGVTWTGPAILESDPSDDWPDRFGSHPHIATDGSGTWLVLCESGMPTKISFARSTDVGATWTEARTLWDGYGIDGFYRPRIATDGAGNWVTVWTSYIGDYEVLASRSTDGGLTWEAPAVLSSGPSGEGWELYQDVANDGVGNWVSVWQENDPSSGTTFTDDDILFARAWGPDADEDGLADGFIEIDIKPWSDANPVNPFSRDMIPVAVLGSEGFHVADVDAATLAFGPSGAAPAHKWGGQRWDVDGDGFPDLLALFRTQETGIAPGDGEACLRLQTLEGEPFFGCDSVSTVPRCGIGFELALLLPPLMWRYGRQKHAGA